MSKSSKKVTKSSEEVTKSLTKLISIIDFIKEGEKNRQEILGFLGLKNQTRNFTTNIKHLIDYGLVEMTQPNKPNSQHQKYRLTEKGKKLLK